MKKFIRTIFVLVLSLVTVALFACEDKKEPVFSAEDAIKVLLVEQETYVSGDFDVPGKLHYKGTDYSILWTSDNACLTVSPQVNANGNYTIVATRPEEGKQTATLTAKVTVGETSATKSFSFNLYPIDVYEISDAYKFKYANKAIKESIELDKEFSYEGKTVQINWTVDDASKDVISIVDGKVEFEAPTAETPVKVWAEFEYNNEKALRPFNMTLIPETTGPVIVSEFADGDSFKFGFYQAEDGKYLYFTGEMNGYYGATTEDGAASTAVTVNVVEGGYQLSFINKEGNKQYITLVASGKYTNFKLVDEVPSTVWTWNAEYSTFVMDVVNTDQPDKSGLYFLGTYGSNKTFGASAISYASNSTNYIAHMYAPGASLPTEGGNGDGGNTDGGNTDGGNTDGGNTGNTGTPATSLVEGQAYIVTAANAIGPLYLKGSIGSGRFDGSYNVSDAIKVYVEISDANYYLYFMNAGVKTYINMDDKAAGGVFVTDKASATVYEWNATLNTLVVADDANNRAFGTDPTKTYTNFSSYDASNAQYNWGQFIPAE